MLASDGTTAMKGHILQVVSYESGASYESAAVSPSSNPETSWMDLKTTGSDFLAATITPAATTSKVMISFHLTGEGNTSDETWRIRLSRAISGGSTTYIQGTAAGSRVPCIGTLYPGYHGDDNDSTPSSFVVANLVDSPSTTSATTYTVQMNNKNGSKTFNLNRTNANTDDSNQEVGYSYITLMEIGG